MEGVLWKWTNYWTGKYLYRLLLFFYGPLYLHWYMCCCHGFNGEIVKSLWLFAMWLTNDYTYIYTYLAVSYGLGVVSCNLLIQIGWQPRWFVLYDGILVYYKSQEEVSQGCKGSLKISACEISGEWQLHMRNLMVKLIIVLWIAQWVKQIRFA